MAIKINDATYDTMGEACKRLGISRATMLRSLKDGFFTNPPEHPQGRGKRVRYFTKDWYETNEKKLKEAREKP